jgi:hypothetical protein
MTAMIAPRGLADLMLTDVLGALVRATAGLPARAGWRLLTPTLIKRVSDVREMVEVSSGSELEAVLLGKERRWSREMRLASTLIYISKLRPGARKQPSRVAAVASMKESYARVTQLLDSSKASDVAIANARVAFYSLFRSAATLLREEITFEGTPMAKVKPHAAVTRMNEVAMVGLALVVGLVSEEPNPAAVEVLAERLLREADTLADILGNAPPNPKAKTGAEVSTQPNA